MKLLIILMAIAVGCYSCATTIHPIVTEENIIVDERLYGTWKKDTTTVMIENYLKSPLNTLNELGEHEKLEKPKTAENKRLAAFAAKVYMISYWNEGYRYLLSGQLTKINGQLYMDLVPEDIKSELEVHGSYNYEKGHLIAKVDVVNNGLKFRFMDGQKIKELVLSGKLKLKHEHEKFFDTFVITASTRELRLFLEKYGNDQSLYPADNVVSLTK